MVDLWEQDLGEENSAYVVEILWIQKEARKPVNTDDNAPPIIVCAFIMLKLLDFVDKATAEEITLEAGAVVRLVRLFSQKTMELGRRTWRRLRSRRLELSANAGILIQLVQITGWPDSRYEWSIGNSPTDPTEITMDAVRDNYSSAFCRRHFCTNLSTY